MLHSVELVCVIFEALTYCTYQRHYLIVNHIGTIRAEHDDFTIRFASSLNQVRIHFHHKFSTPYL